MYLTENIPVDTATKTSTATDGGTKFTFDETKSKLMGYTNHRPKDTQNICEFLTMQCLSYLPLLFLSSSSNNPNRFTSPLHSSNRIHVLFCLLSLQSGVDFNENFPEGTHALTVVPTTEDKIMISTLVIP